MTDRWRWDSSLYAGSAPYYVRGRVPYPAALVELLIDELDLDGTGRLLDLGCGPGSLTLPLAPYVEQVVAVDADEAMLSAGRALADAAGITHVVWRHARAEDLPSSLGGFRVATLAQSFHWMDRERVAGLLHGWLDPGGALVFVRATTHEGVAGTDRLPHPRPPREEVTALVEEFLGERRRAGRGYREADAVGGGEPGAMEAGIFDTAGFSGPRRFEVPGWVVTRSSDEIVASVFSLSYAAPHLFGDDVGSFEQRLRSLLDEVSPSGLFSESLREITVDLWDLR